MTAEDKAYQPQAGTEVIYLAGGCFWGLENLMNSLPGVVAAISGYANGRVENPTYPQVKTGTTGHRETVRVVYDPDKISLEAILFAFFSVVDPTVENRQAEDIGSQYQTGIYYQDQATLARIERVVAVERERAESFRVEIKPLTCFYEAEDYHQRYLEKNPGGYCHIPRGDIEDAALLKVDPAPYMRPDREELRQRLTETQYQVTQEGLDQPPYPPCPAAGRGLYVDIATKEPLFSAAHRLEDQEGRLCFSQAVDPNVVVLLDSIDGGELTTEIRSRAGNSHLGWLTDSPLSPTDLIFSINGAALGFCPESQMAEEGYGYLTEYLL